MIRFFLPLIFTACSILQLSAQENDNDSDNIIIESATETYRFIQGDDEHPVLVKQQSGFMYSCTRYRASIPIVEFYNDQHELNDISVKLNNEKLKGFRPKHDYYSSDGIFYSDARVCYFSLPFDKKGAKGEVTINKTILDPRYFTSIYFTEPYHVKEKVIRIFVPSWMKIDLKEFNFKGYSIESKKTADGDNTLYTYIIKDAAAVEKEKQAPGMSYLAPHLLVMTKQAEPAGKKITYFNTLSDQYGWYRKLVKQIGNETPSIAAKAVEITKGITTDIDKVKAIYLWVQNNIRYIAFEDGIAGFKPEKAQDVLSKKYGDCKGMANLTAEMLKAINLDGRLCWLGTNHIAYDYSTPSLGVDNHMICAWMYKGEIYYLDATEKYIGFNEIAERIQGRQVLIEDGENYLLKSIPVANPNQNSSIEKRKLAVEGNNLKGKVVQIWKGENKEWLLTRLHDTKIDKQDESLKKFLAEGNSDYEISNLKVTNLNDYNSDLKIEYDLLFKNAVVTIGNEMYIDIDNRKDFSQMNFDTAKRKLPYQFHFKTHLLFETEIDLPANVKAGPVPSVLKIDHPMYGMSGHYKVEKNRVKYYREIMLKNVLLPRNKLAEWNENIGRLNEFYNNQLSLTN